jgi:ABC-type multidrug transport system fused ATPase/permease subunit
MKYYGYKNQIVFSLLLAISNAILLPAAAILICNLIFLIKETPSRNKNYIDERNYWVLLLLLVSVLCGLSKAFATVLFTKSNERLAHDLRKKLWESIIHK